MILKGCVGWPSTTTTWEGLISTTPVGVAEAEIRVATELAGDSAGLTTTGVKGCMLDAEVSANCNVKQWKPSPVQS